jgi:tRNA nucleotidyltransferase (CCA-adding enzyme)
MMAGEVFVRPGDDIDHLQQVMTTSGWGQVPVVDPDTGEIIGIVTRTDLLKTLSEGAALVPGHVRLDRRLDVSLPPAQLALLKAIAAQASSARVGAYVVGGFVRDLLLERPSLDFDVVVEGDALALAEALKQRLGGRIVSHSRFGTAKWWIAEIRAELARKVGLHPSINPLDLPESLDLISARTEFYEYPTALPTVERSSIKLDLHRRDFTINTMAIRLDGRHYGDLYDYWGGLNDLRQGQVRVLHSLSFVDDPTRMLRAVRFEQRFGFRIELRTLQLMGEAGELVRQVSGHRLRHELDLILAEEQAVAMLARLHELNLLAAIHPDLPWSAEIARRVSIAMDSPPDPGWNLPAQFAHLPVWRALVYLAWIGGLPVEKSLSAAETLRFPAALAEALKEVSQLLVELPRMAGWKPSQVVRRLDSAPVLALCALQFFNLSQPAPDLLNQYLTTWQHVRTVTNGVALRKMGIAPGPLYGRLLEALRSAWLDGKIGTYEQEKELLSELLLK